MVQIWQDSLNIPGVNFVRISVEELSDDVHELCSLLADNLKRLLS